MSEEQNIATVVSPEKIPTPLLVKIIAWLSVIGGGLNVLSSIPALLLFGGFGGINVLSELALLRMLIAVLNVVIGIGLLKLQKWALYLETVATALYLGVTIFGVYKTNTFGVDDFIMSAVQVLVLGYLWSVNKKFK